MGLTCRSRPAAVSPSGRSEPLGWSARRSAKARRVPNWKVTGWSRRAQATGDRIGRPANVGSRKRARAFPKGRQLDLDALEQVRELLKDRPRRPDLLIEYLHLIQDRYHYISARHLKALCEEMRLPQAAAYEVATFYAHFDVVKEGETPPPVHDHPCLRFHNLRYQRRQCLIRGSKIRRPP